MADGQDDDDTENCSKSPDMDNDNNEDVSDSGTTINEEDTLQALLLASLNANDEEDLNDVESIAGEFSTLNTTIDELNKFLDRWDERHSRLRVQIREALEEDERDRNNKVLPVAASTQGKGQNNTVMPDSASTQGKGQPDSEESNKGKVDTLTGSSRHSIDKDRDPEPSECSTNLDPSVKSH